MTIVRVNIDTINSRVVHQIFQTVHVTKMTILSECTATLKEILFYNLHVFLPIVADVAGQQLSVDLWMDLIVSLQ